MMVLLLDMIQKFARSHEDFPTMFQSKQGIDDPIRSAQSTLTFNTALKTCLRYYLIKMSAAVIQDLTMQKGAGGNA